MSDVQLYQGRCEAILPTLPAESVGLILTDPPYFRVKDEWWDRQWDTAGGFLAWMGELCAEWRRVLKPNGSLFCFASPQMAARVECKVGETFNVLNRIRWVKENGWHQKAKKEALRSFLSPCEEIVFAEQHGNPCEPLRAWIDAEREAAGLSPEDMNELLGFRREGGMASRKYLGQTQWYLPTAGHYIKLQAATGRFARPYDEVRREHDLMRRPFFVNADVPAEDTWHFETVPPYHGKHPCEKPAALIEHMILASTRPGDTVLDCFAGSGVVLQVARDLGRKAIGIEVDGEWCRRARRRLEQNVLSFDPSGAA